MGGEQGSTTLIRGFKVSVATLDAFLAANKVDETYGTPPFYSRHPDNDPISRLLHAKVLQHDPAADKQRFRVLIPDIVGMGFAKTAYVAYAWAAVLAHREVDLEADLPAEVPMGFEELRQEILHYGSEMSEKDKIAEDGKMGVYLVVTYNLRGCYNMETHRGEGFWFGS